MPMHNNGPYIDFEAALKKIKGELKKCLDLKDDDTYKQVRLIAYGKQFTCDLFDANANDFILHHDKSTPEPINYMLEICHKREDPDYITTDNTSVSGFRLIELPGCCGVVVSTGAYVDPRFRNKGIGTILNKLRVEIARARGYTVMICTINDRDDGRMERLLRRNWWEEVFSFINKRTDNTVTMYSIFL